MQIKSVTLTNFKRFTNLHIQNIPETAKLVVLLGPNGCGKTSLFEAFKVWHGYRGYSYTTDEEYYRKYITNSTNVADSINIKFYDDNKYFEEDYKSAFYFRTAFRNSPSVSVNSLSKMNSPLDFDFKKLITNDEMVNDNFQRLYSYTMKQFMDDSNRGKTVGELRDEILESMNKPLSRIFPDLKLNELGNIVEEANFYFSKGVIKKYKYENLSSGEKSIFDLILDMVIKTEYFKNTIFCIDEPETHIHTSLQAKFLNELFHLIPENSQLWIATHSFGMLKEARKLAMEHSGEIVFLNFDGYDFDEEVILEPSNYNTDLWDKMLEITLDDYSSFISPEIIVFCEGNNQGKKRKDFDARCYSNIFASAYPNTLFYSLGSCNDIEKSEPIINFIKAISPNSQIVRLIDRDDRTKEEIADLNKDGIKVLSKRNLESYILDDEVLEKWCISVNQESKIEEVLKIKQDYLEKSIERGNAPDDLKSPANETCTEIKKCLGLTQCGNNGETIMRDTLSKLITPDMKIYQILKEDIFED